MKKLSFIVGVGFLLLAVGCGGQPKPIVDDNFANKVQPSRVSDKIKKPTPKLPTYSNGKYSKIPINPKI